MKPHLRQRLVVEESAKRLTRFFESVTELMKVVARACGHNSFRDFNHHDLTTFSHDMHRLTGIAYGGIIGDR